MQNFREFLLEESKKNTKEVKNSADKTKEKNKELSDTYEKAAKHHIKMEKKIQLDIASGSAKKSKDELKILAAHHGWARHHYSKAAAAYKSGNAILGDAHITHAKESVGKTVEMQGENNKLARY